MAKITNLPNEFDNLHLGDVLVPGEPRLQGGKTVLQCGARPGDGWIRVFNAFKMHGYNRFDILEIHKPNVDWLRKQNSFKLGTIVHGDIRKIDEYEELLDTYDVIVFWHGWEHCTYEETVEALPKVISKCSRAHIAGMPWGKWDQGPIKNNPHEKHVHHWYPHELERIGFNEIYTFNASSKGKGPDKHNVMYGVIYKDEYEKRSLNK